MILYIKFKLKTDVKSLPNLPNDSDIFKYFVFDYSNHHCNEP